MRTTRWVSQWAAGFLVACVLAVGGVATASVAAAATSTPNGSAPYGPMSSVAPGPAATTVVNQGVVSPGGAANTGFSAPASGLAFTGTDVVIIVAIAAAALALGGMFVLAARRRSPAGGHNLSGSGI